MNSTLLIFFILISSNIALTAQKTDKSGYLKISSTNIDTFYVTLNNDYRKSMIFKSGDSVLVPVGFQYVRISGYDFDDITFSIGVDENKTSHFRFHGNKFKHKSQSDACWINHFRGNVAIVSDHDTQIFINDTLMSVGKFSFFPESRLYKLTLKNSTGKKIIKELKFDSIKFTFIQEYIRPDKFNMYLASLIPGGGQYYKNEHSRGNILFGLTSFALIFGISSERFNSESGSNGIIGFTLFGLLYFYSLIDGISEPEYGYRKSEEYNDYLNHNFYYK